MNPCYAKMERCLRLATAADADAVSELLTLLSDACWEVRFAATVALGDCRAPAAVGPLCDLLDAEDRAPLYTQTQDHGGGPAGGNRIREVSLPAGTTAEIADAWQRRGRIKQAACLALGSIGAADARSLSFLERYATDAREDYAVRAAACKALGMLRPPSARGALERAADDQEWCTRTEARKALAALG